MPDRLHLALAFAVVFALSVVATALALPLLRRVAGRQHVREDVPATHLAKAGTPSMGGLPMLAALVLGTVGCGLLAGALTWRVGACLAGLVGFATVGLLDDLRKLGDRKSRGILARYRITAELLVALLLAVAVYREPGGQEGAWPAWVGVAWWPAPLGIALQVLVVVGGANAMNLTDGLDGLAAGLSAIAGLGLATACLTLHQHDLALLAVAGSAAAAGFLVLNRKPAKVWMGDVGSLGLGAALAGVAIAARVEFLFAIIGAVFVAEALSVILQVISFKSTGKRIFRMAPLHHHFELGGMSETRVVVSFWIAGAVAAALGLSLLVATYTPSA